MAAVRALSETAEAKTPWKASEAPYFQEVERHTAEEQKKLGAFYTPEPMARKLAGWALRSPSDTMVDPSFGGLVFLAAAKRRLVELGASERDAVRQIYGVDLDPKAHEQVREAELGITEDDLIVSDFFAVKPGGRLPQVTANIGNPPYVRYQNWDDPQGLAAEACEALGVKLTKLASLWAPFIVHGCRFLAPGGRMAQVLPAEILFAQYAAPIVGLLTKSFAKVTLVAFEERVFPGALEEIVLLFADGYGRGPAEGIGVVECKDLESLDLRLVDGVGSGYLISETPLLRLLTEEQQTLYQRVAADPRVKTLGALAAVDIGVVTGANEFFVLTAKKADEYGLDASLLRGIVGKAADVPGARLRRADLEKLEKKGRPTQLFLADGTTAPEMIATAAAFLAEGETRDYRRRYKCRIRTPWWAVPLPKRGTPDAFLTYMNDVFPRFVFNEAKVLSTNTIHNVSLKNGTNPRALSAGFYNSLTLLSAELVGRSYGGGTLKLEPTEAERLLVPPIPKELTKQLPEVDRLVRDGDLDGLVKLVDPLVLKPLGLRDKEIRALRAAREKLFGRRRARSKASI